MNSFLDQIAKIVLQKSELKGDELCVVFPSRRACTWFKDTLSRQLDGPIWAPKILAFEDFVSSQSIYEVLDPVSLAFELYPIYKRHIPDVPFEKYYSWASKMVSDFDEVDRYLIDGDSIYKNLYELKAIDETVAAWLPGEDEETPLRSTFIKFWERMGGIYKDFRSHLIEQKKAYGGLALREVAENIGTESKSSWKHLIFAGFSALSPAEEMMIRTLLENGNAEFITDTDRWYVDDPNQEAGKFFRELREKWDAKFLTPPSDFFETIQKKIRINGTPKQVAQTKFAGLAVREILTEHPDPKETAVVLGDENFLFPLLESMPKEVREINVTMGYPLRHTALYALFHSIIGLHENYERQGGSAYYHKDVKRILSHSAIRKLIPDKSYEWLWKIKTENRVYIKPQLLIDDDLGFLFQPWTDIQAATENLIEICERIRTQQEDEHAHAVEGEFLFHYYRLIRKLKSKIDSHDLTFGISTFRKVFRELIKQVRVPFSGEPLGGVQVMGLLETRSLDFKNIVFLAMNEGTVPPSTSFGSFIPFSLRKAFGLPVQEDRDAIIAYHFYRLLQRAENIDFFYNTEAGNLGSGEKSRFLRQIEVELAKRFPNIEAENKTLTFPTGSVNKAPITIEKTPEVQQAIEEFVSENGLSPTALLSWLKCPLQFYYRNILGIDEYDDIQESLQADTFGQVVHKSVEYLFGPYQEKELTAQDIQTIETEIEPAVEKAFKEVAKSAQISFGKNQLLYRVIVNLMKQLLESENPPFTILGLEQRMEFEFQRNEKPVKLKGFIDRVDQVNRGTRIIDYKTGTVQSLSYREWDDVRKDPNKKKEAFQLATYAWLYGKLNPNEPVPRTGVIWFKALSKGLQEIKVGSKYAQLSAEHVGEFEDLLMEIIDEILDPADVIKQTEDLDRCNHCSFSGICGRN